MNKKSKKHPPIFVRDNPGILTARLLRVAEVTGLNKSHLTREALDEKLMKIEALHGLPPMDQKAAAQYLR
jgi:hypothetical protein